MCPHRGCASTCNITRTRVSALYVGPFVGARARALTGLTLASRSVQCYTMLALAREKGADTAFLNVEIRCAGVRR